MAIKPINVEPMTGLLDTRSPASALAKGEWRYLLNFGVTGKNKAGRIPGWDKYLTRTDYNNQDLHDQLLNLTGLTRKPVTMLFEAQSTTKLRKMIAGTEQALFALNPSTGNWKVISDELGAAGARWRKPAQEGDVVIFTNNLNPPVYWNFDQAANDGGDQSVSTIPDLADKFSISKVGTVISWKGCIFLMNVVQEGAVRTYRIFWSDYQKPLSYEPGEGSIAGSADIYTSETILAALPLRDRLLVYTNDGIWEGTVGSVLNGPAFSFVKRYEPVKTDEACLKYPNTLVSFGDEHFFASSDGFYVYNLFTEKPTLVPWMHKSSNLMFDDLNIAACDVHNAAYNSKRKELLVSYAKGDETLPSETLVFNTEYKHAYVLDHGFSAMLMNTPRENVKSIRDWFLEQCICASAAETDETFTGFEKEGGYCTPPEEVACEPPTSIFTTVGLAIEGAGITTEDYTQTEASLNSLCARLDGMTMQDLCEAELRADECNAALRFVVASSTDYCLKQFSDNYYREMALTWTGCGTYSKTGYRTKLRTGPMNFGDPLNEKEIHRLEVEIFPAEQTVPSLLGLRVGVSAQAKDPNVDNCGIVWVVQDTKEIECLSDSTEAEHLANNTRPDETMEWPLWYVGKNLYMELEITNPNVTPVDTGGACVISRMTMDLRGVAHNYV
jgi:hypothetical protein